MTPDQMKELAARLREHARRPHGVVFDGSAEDADLDAAADLIEQMAVPSLSEQMRKAGFTRRDNRLQCDECGELFTPQFLPIHKCKAEQADGMAQRVPLSDYEALILLQELDPRITTVYPGYLAIIRATERHHGIRSEK